ncbi:unnamed protein product [Acanthoscelides obtectus]|uniref:Uncharacterized protein n=1 Tax=Acanthoscelides obtectus TaxID=200917 RepID=A0A9P0LWK6_ACAOB|nr:unnamed protein product [Acanthoscelides obtectus]CAK1675414.1 hypothetical protein AOBTE_LOCUS30206 [Acanthoscelides obtectus]
MKDKNQQTILKYQKERNQKPIKGHWII